MNPTLRKSDAVAVDLILNRVAAVQNDGNNGKMAQFSSASSHVGVSSQQIAAVEKILHLLEQMPPIEPAPDLLRRTIEHVDASIHAPMRGISQPVIDHGRPVA